MNGNFYRVFAAIATCIGNTVVNKNDTTDLKQ